MNAPQGADKGLTNMNSVQLLLKRFQIVSCQNSHITRPANASDPPTSSPDAGGRATSNRTGTGVLGLSPIRVHLHPLMNDTHQQGINSLDQPPVCCWARTASTRMLSAQVLRPGMCPVIGSSVAPGKIPTEGIGRYEDWFAPRVGRHFVAADLQGGCGAPKHSDLRSATYQSSRSR